MFSFKTEVMVVFKMINEKVSYHCSTSVSAQCITCYCKNRHANISYYSPGTDTGASISYNSPVDLSPCLLSVPSE